MNISFQEALVSVTKCKTSFNSFDIKDLNPELEIAYIDKELEHMVHLGIIELEMKTINGKQYKLK